MCSKPVTSIMAGKYKGGRGKKAPYSTSVIRVPSDLVPYVEQMAERYINLLDIAGVKAADLENQFAASECKVTFNDAVLAANQILSQKKSAKQSVIKLLQVLYPQSNFTESLLNK